MHARVTTLHGASTDVDAGIDNFRSNVVPFTQEHGNGAILLIDRESGDALAITLWEDEQAMQASENSANTLRTQAADQMGATDAPTVGRYEVAVFEV
jgi:quinol monooxygenase YgiN